MQFQDTCLSVLIYHCSLEKKVGVPEFWLQVFRNSDALSELIKVLFCKQFS